MNMERISHAHGTAATSRKASRAPRLVGLLIAGALLLAGCTQPAEEVQAPPVADSGAPRLLFVQDAESGAATPAGDGLVLLVLSGFDAETLWFTDRPDRDAGVLPSAEFASLWNGGKDSFAEDPPNAALALRDEAGDTAVFVFELMDPVYDEGTRIMKYLARPIAADQAFLDEHHSLARHGNEMPAQFGAASLFIDTTDPSDGCLWVCPSEEAVPRFKAGSPGSGPLKFGQQINIRVSASGPYLNAPISGQWETPGTVTLASGSPGEDAAFTISCPLMGFDDRTFSCQRGIDRALQYGDYVAFARISGTPGEQGYREQYLGVFDKSAYARDPGPMVWVNEYDCCGYDVLRTWRIHDPRNVASTAEVQSGDPVVMIDLWPYHDITLRHPGGALGIQAIELDDWLRPVPVPTDGDSTWYFQRA